MNKKTNANGITLIALVVTIIVLLILAGVAINLVAGGDGIMAKTQNAVIRHNIEEAKERVILRVSEYHKDYYQATYVDKTSSVNVEIGDWIADAHKGEEIEAGDYIFTITGNSAPYKITILKHNKLPGEVYGKLLLNGKVIWDDIEEGGGNGENPGEDEPESEVINRNITEPGTYEMVIDAGQVVNWDSVVIQYYKYIENSLSLRIYTSDDEINWTEEVASEPTMNKQLAKYDISQATRTQFLKVEVTLAEVDGENSELDYVLVNFYKYREVELEPEITTTAVETNGVYTVPTSSSGQVEAIGLATVTQKVTIPNDAEEYMVDFSESFGSPTTTLKITNPDSTTEEYADTNVRKIAIKPSAQVEATTTLDAGDGVGKLKVFAKESAVSNEEKTSAEQPEEVIEWKTVEQKRFVYNNGGTGYWEKCLVNGTEVDKTGILMESENATKRIKVRYQTSSNGESWSGSFTNIEDAADAQFLRVVVDYQVYGNIEYGDTSNDQIKVILNDGSWLATFKDEDGTELFKKRVYFENNKTASYTLPTYPGEKEGKKFMYWKTGTQNCTAGSTYNLTANTEFTAIFGYTVSYDANGGTGSVPESAEYVEGEVITLSTTSSLTKSGFKFLGWATSTSATEAMTSYTVGKENVVFYAVWRSLTAGATVNSNNRNLAGTTTGYSYKNPVIPQGFNPVNAGTAKWEYTDDTQTEVKGWNEGLVIEDSYNQNQFVWVPVDGSIVKYEKWCTANISYENCSTATDTGTVDGIVYSSIPVSDETEQIRVNGGFYVARYEAGIATTTTSQSTSTNNVYTQVPVSKLGSKVWNYVGYARSYVASEKMVKDSVKYGNNKSGLMTGTAWDTIMDWYQENGIGVQSTDVINTSGETVAKQDWGTYYDLAYSGNGKYFTYSSSASSWKTGAFSHKAGNTSTYHYHGSGLNSDGIKKNIADLGGNVWEWTSESYSSNRVYRGGRAANSVVASGRNSKSTSTADWSLGFRVMMYVQ